MSAKTSPLDRWIGFCLENKLLALMMAMLLIAWGIGVAPFDWKIPGVERAPVPVDAIPDTGENQQIVFTEWAGRSPQDVEDQITYPLTAALLGVPGVESVRSSSMFGFSSIQVVFGEDVEFYWSRSRLLEKLNSLPAGELPFGVQPQLGPDATSLGQIFWYTLEGRDESGNPTGGWDLHELRSAQDWFVRYALSSVSGVAEVASIGGHTQEYQVDVDPEAMRAHGVTLDDVYRAVAASNADVGARTIELNRVEYVVRGLGLLESIQDIEDTVVRATANVPVTVGQVATVSIGPGLRRGALDKNGAEAVGGVVVARYGANPLAVIEALKAKMDQVSAGLPEKTLADGRTSRLEIVPFYDRSGLIRETLGTLGSALELQVLVTVIVLLVMIGHVRGAILVSAMLPLSVLFCFVGMKQLGVDANIVALSGIAIAIGTMVDVGIVLTENILRHIRREQGAHARLATIRKATSEVGGAVLTAVLTTVISFLPVLTMEGAEGKLFRPLASTKTLALLASIAIALTLLPPAAHLLLRGGIPSHKLKRVARFGSLVGAFAVCVVLARRWEPLGPLRDVGNLVFTLGVIGAVLLAFQLLRWIYEPALRWCLANKLLFLSAPLTLVVLGLLSWLGFERVVGTVVGPEHRDGQLWRSGVETWPGLGKEFMPRLDEGSFLVMPVTMPHASIGEAFDLLQQQDLLMAAVPEVEDVVGKIGRVDSPLDPAPISMVETIVTYQPEYKVDADGERERFAYNGEADEFERDEFGQLVPDPGGRIYRNWRDEVTHPNQIWEAIAEAAKVPGMTTASMLQPIETRRIMLQTGMRAPMGIKVFGPDLETLERVALDFERMLREVDSVSPESVFADRVIGKPYLEIDIDRHAIARFGLSVRAVQDAIEVAIGGRHATTAIEGRERYSVRVRYPRELRSDLDDLAGVLVETPGGAQVPLGQLSEIRYEPGPQNIKSEDTFLVAYVLFDGRNGAAEVDVVEDAKAYIASEIDSGRYGLPTGVSYSFAGNYENQVRATARLRVVLPLALFLIFVLLYLLFRSAVTTSIVFSAVFVAWSGGFLMLWLYGQPWFLNATIWGVDLRELFGVQPVHLSVAVWVGFLALFGIATDDGVILATYLKQTLEREKPRTRQAVRDAVVAAGKRRIGPCLMTTATTTLALLPVLTSTGRGAGVMIPMAIPSLGGMMVALTAVFVVPTLYCWVEERKQERASAD